MAKRAGTTASSTRTTRTPASTLDVGRRTAALKAILTAKPGAEAKPMGAPRATTPSVLIFKVMGKMFGSCRSAA